MKRTRVGVAIALLTALAGAFLWVNGDHLGNDKAGRDEADKELAERVQEEAKEVRERYDEPQAAQEFAALKRSDDVRFTGQAKPQVAPVDAQRYVVAKQQADALPRYDSSKQSVVPNSRANDYNGSFTNLGPGNIGGRTKAIVIDPTNANTMFAAATAGGIWKTTNGGTTWTPLDDFMTNLAVNSLAMVPGSPSVLYAGTGEGFFNGDAVRGAGIFKTTNGGTTWTQLANTANGNFYYVNDIVVSPLDANRVYAATRAGVYRSPDAGATWTQVVSGAAVNGCFDLAIRTDAGATDRIFVSCGSFATLTIYRNTDAGGAGTWDSVYTNSSFGRTSLAIAPSSQDTVYALASSIVSGSNLYGLGAVLRSTTGGSFGSWTVRVDNTSATTLNRLLLTNTPYGQGCFGAATLYNQGWYDNVIAVDPLDANRVWTGGVDLFRSDDGGANFGLASYWYKAVGDPRKSHADQHAITFDPGFNGTTNTTMFVGDDGGIYKTTDSRAATATGASASCDATTTSATVWSNLNNGYQVTQFYDGMPFPNGTSYFGGTQDNGTLLGTNGGGPNAWTQVTGGDGGYVAQDPTNTNVMFTEYTRLSIQKSTAGPAGPFNSATSGITESSNNFLFINPFHMSKANPQVVFTGGLNIWRTTNQATSWVQASAIRPGAGSVSALTTFDGDANRALVGMSDGYILRSTTALTTTSSVSWANLQPRSGFVSSIIFHPTNNQIAYATYSTFGGVHLWRTTDGGATWSARDGSGGTALPDIPAHSLAINPADPTHLYLGTDLGVFVSLDEGITWARENAGYANVPTEKVVINTVGGVKTLFAFSHGRSAWKVLLAARRTPGDYDGNGTADRAVYRDGAWYVDGQATTYFGLGSDLPVPGDYDGNGTTDKAVYRNGAWYINGQSTVFLGLASDIPVPGDYDGNGTTDAAVFRPSTGAWYVNGQSTVFLGASGDIPVPGDYDANGTTDKAVFRNGAWYINGQATVYLGLSGDIPVPGDYDGNGTTDQAVFRNGAWYTNGQASVFFGLSGDTPQPGDYDGNATTDRAVFRNGAWYTNGQTTVYLGLTGDIPLSLPQAIYRFFF